MQKFFPRIQEWIWEIMQGRNLILLRLSDKIWPSRAVWSVSVISLYSPHCRPPNNIQLFFPAFLRDADCCKGHLATCPSPKPSLWLSDLTYSLHSYHYIYSHKVSWNTNRTFTHWSTYTSKIFFKLSQQIRQEFCRRQLHLSKPDDSFQRWGAQCSE